jgi:formate dehydrogenase iron-sulfur subunit
LALPAEAKAPEAIPQRILLDLDRCVGCKTCAAACYHSHHLMPAVQHARLAVGALPLLCRQCERPPCVEACPSGAMERDPSGVVRRSMLLCWGCGSCIIACPFGVLPTDLTRRVVPKCDLCEDITTAGGRPRCVAACPAGALDFVAPDEVPEKDLQVIGGRATGQNPLRRR